MLIGSSYRIKHFGSARTIPNIVQDNGVIKRVSHTMSLGMITDERLMWDRHEEYIFKKMRRNIGVLGRVRNDSPKNSLIALYNTLVEPYLRYCDVVWGHCSETLLNKLQMLQNRAAKIISKVSSEEANHEALLNKLNWLNF